MPGFQRLTWFLSRRLNLFSYFGAIGSTEHPSVGSFGGGKNFSQLMIATSVLSPMAFLIQSSLLFYFFSSLFGLPTGASL